jgi:asparagine synthase (glutamine-hydrolysing)
VCGICGLVSLARDEPVDRAALERMTEALVHRGPDDSGYHVDGQVGLGARRLAIIDLEGGHQPISSEDGAVTVVQNGEIYNHEALHDRLAEAGHVFATRCDTEVLVHGYEEHGPDFVRELRGMFAFALWDARRRKLLLARDRYGIKPLYYRVGDNLISFASELKSLVLAPGPRPELDLEALEAFLAFNSIPAPLTIYEGVRKLPPGHVLTWSGDEGARLTEYAAELPERAAELRREDEGELARELRERLRDSVRAHLIADVPVGVLLSGGIDSSVLTALAAEESAERVSTFSIGFEEREFDELGKARLVADRYGTDHHELVVRPDAVALLTELAKTFDEPLADSSALPTYLVSKLASDNVKVALSGEGADELFGGYYTYVADLIAPRLRPLARVTRPLVERLPSTSGKVSFDYKAKRFVGGASLPPLERHHAWKEIFGADARAELLVRRDPTHADPLDVYRRRYALTEGAGPLARLQDVDRAIYLVDDLLVKTDRASMAHSLEARVPFLDPVVTELALALPDPMNVRRFAKKRLLRRAAEPLLPPELLRAKKQGFSIPAAAWLRGELEPFAREVLAPSEVARQGFFDPDAVTRLIDRHVSRREDLSRQLWGLLTFALWHDRHVGG